jgi:hypothetical protein
MSGSEVASFAVLCPEPRLGRRRIAGLDPRQAFSVRRRSNDAMLAAIPQPCRPSKVIAVSFVCLIVRHIPTLRA